MVFVDLKHITLVICDMAVEVLNCQYIVISLGTVAVWVSKVKFTMSSCLHENIQYIHTYTCLTALFPGLPGWAGTRNVKPVWILLQARDSEWQWHHLGHMQVCTSLYTDNHASTLPPLSFLQTGFPSCCPTHSVKGSKHWRHIQVLHKYLGVKCKYQALWCHCICFLFLCYLQHFDSCLLTSEQFLLQHFTQLEELLISASMP